MRCHESGRRCRSDIGKDHLSKRWLRNGLVGRLERSFAIGLDIYIYVFFPGGLPQLNLQLVLTSPPEARQTLEKDPSVQKASATEHAFVCTDANGSAPAKDAGVRT